MYRPRGIAPYAYGLPQIQPRQSMPGMGVSSTTTGQREPQQQQNPLNFGDAAGLYRFVKAEAAKAANTPAFQADAIEAIPNAAIAPTGVTGVSPVGMGMAPDPLLYGGETGFDALVGGAGAEGLASAGTEGLLGAAGVAPAMEAAAPAIMEAALPAAAIEAVGAPSAAAAGAGGLAGLGALGPLALGGLGIFGLGKAFDWW